MTKRIPHLDTDLKNFPGEIWKGVEGVEHKYQVSNMGRVKSLDTYQYTYNETRKILKKGIIIKQYIEPTKINKSPRLYCCINTKTWLMTTLVVNAFMAKRETTEKYWWKDHNPLNNKVNNIMIVSHTDYLRLKIGLKPGDELPKGSAGATIKRNKWLKENGIFENGILVAKKCKACGEMLPIEEFKRGHGKESGICYICKNDGRLMNPGHHTRLMKLMDQGKKWCPTCNTIKDLDEFGNSKNCYLGKTGNCLECLRNKDRIRHAKKSKNPGKLLRNAELLKEGKAHCQNCDTTKDLDEFRANRSTKSGRDGTCKICRSKQERKRRNKKKSQQ
jgi:hypothetical protein